jgi:uncharacterized protein
VQQPTYPGVYIEEIPGSPATIPGAPVSVCAFVGRARMGPLNQPTAINSYSDFETVFGGLWIDSVLSYSVLQFFQNGGGAAFVVRVASAATPPASASASLDFSLKLQARASGATGNSYTVNVSAAGTPAGKRGPYFSLVLAGSPNPAAYTVSLNNADGADFILSATQLGAGASSDILACGAVNEIPNSIAPTASPLHFSGGATGRPAAVCLPIQSSPQYLALTASNPGSWANALQARVDYGVFPVTNSALFNLTLQLLDPASVGQPNPSVLRSEFFQNLSLDSSSPQYAPSVLAQQSLLVAAALGTLSAGGAYATGFTLLTGGADGGAISDADILGDPAARSGMYALNSPQSQFNMLCLPPLDRNTDLQPATFAAAESFCVQQRALVLVDAPAAWNTAQAAIDGVETGAFGALRNANAALFFPRIQYADPLLNGVPAPFAPSASVAGVMARTDSARGVWKAAAGSQANLTGAIGLSVLLTDADQGRLNPLAINALRLYPISGAVVYGARTMLGADILQSQWKFVPVRRTALYIENSLYAGLQFAVFEPNAEPLWSQIRLSVGSFLQDLFQQGAFAGRTPQQAYFVQCDSTNNPTSTVNQGAVYVKVGFAPVKPAEFVIIQLQLQSPG